MLDFLQTLKFIVQHPLNRRHKGSAVGRFLRWQIGSRLLPGGAVVPFVGGTRLLVSRGMTGATGNVYCGLHEFEDMGFALHLLRPGDRFVDVGANIGSYTILAGGASGADCVAFEPIPATFEHLRDNIRLNGLEARVKARNVGIGAMRGTVSFTADLDTVNHVLASGEVARNAIEVDVETLDSALERQLPTLVKIDVEGFETEVLKGAQETLARPQLLAVIVELNGSGARYGSDEQAIHRSMLESGFVPARYDPLRRTLEKIESRRLDSGNTLYVRGFDTVAERLRTSPAYRVAGISL